MTETKKDTIQDLSFQFALGVIEFCEHLNDRKKFVIAQQLLKSGTSIGANVREAQGAESRKDFIHKMKIAYKEAEETEYWLLLCKESDSLTGAPNLESKVISIKKMLSKIISSSIKNN